MQIFYIAFTLTWITHGSQNRSSFAKHLEPSLSPISSCIELDSVFPFNLLIYDRQRLHACIYLPKTSMFFALDNLDFHIFKGHAVEACFYLFLLCYECRRCLSNS